MFIIDLGASTHYSRLGVSVDATAKEIRENARNIAGDLDRMQKTARTPEEKQELEAQRLAINGIADELTSTAKRIEYDKRNVHLSFFAVRKAAAPLWYERELLLRWMHQAVCDFLVQRGEPVDPLTDLERTDFTADFTANELLERLLQDAKRG